MKIRSMSLCIRNMQIKTVMRCHNNPFRKAERPIIPSAVEAMEQLEFQTLLLRMENAGRKSVWQFLLKIILPITLLLDIYPREVKEYVHTKS